MDFYAPKCITKWKITLRIILIVLHDETIEMYEVTNSEFRIFVCDTKKEFTIKWNIWTLQQDYNSYSWTLLNQHKQNHVVEQPIKNPIKLQKQ